MTTPDHTAILKLAAKARAHANGSGTSALRSKQLSSYVVALCTGIEALAAENAERRDLAEGRRLQMRYLEERKEAAEAERDELTKRLAAGEILLNETCRQRDAEYERAEQAEAERDKINDYFVSSQTAWKAERDKLVARVKELEAICLAGTGHLNEKDTRIAKAEARLAVAVEALTSLDDKGHPQNGAGRIARAALAKIREGT